MFVWRWNMVDGKLWRENGKENFSKLCLVRWGGRKINDRTWMFSLRTHQKVFSPKWGENWREKISYLMNKNTHIHLQIDHLMEENAHVHLHMGNLSYSFLFSFSFFLVFSCACCLFFFLSFPFLDDALFLFLFFLNLFPRLWVW